MLKLVSILSLLLLVNENLFSQNNTTTYWDLEYNQVDKDEASYYRISKPHPDGTSKLFVQTFYINGKIKSNATCYSQYCFKKEGYFVSYFENGQLEIENNIISGKKFGDWKEWYENGQIKSLVSYSDGVRKGIGRTWYRSGQLKMEVEFVNDSEALPYRREKVKNYWDKNGLHLVIDGAGEAKFYHQDSLVVSDIGFFEKGYKTGLWKGYDNQGKLNYEEIYSTSSVTGTSWDKEGNEHAYVTLNKSASPKKGLSDFVRFIDKRVKYPKIGRSYGAKGTTYIKFIVDKNGQLTNVTASDALGSKFKKQVEKLIANYGSWNPSVKRGQPSETTMLLPLKLKLSN